MSAGSGGKLVPSPAGHTGPYEANGMAATRLADQRANRL